MTKTLFVTGGSRGIGEAVVRRAAGKYNVVFTYRANRELAEKLERELGSLGVVAVCCDVRDETSVKRAVEFAKKRFGKIDVLVNNVGVSKSGLLVDMDEGEWDDVFDVNAKGAFLTSKAVLPDMLSARRGAIVNVSSIWGQVGASCEVAYSASKAAVIGFTKALAKEVAPMGVRVNAVAPGAVDTDMMKEYSQCEIEDICKEIPLGRLARPEEIADAILFLVENEYITGTTLAVNGGWHTLCD
ncbi:MAG: 3-oxoacyl-ACP reductase FabG [Clostridia bacterium]|nr:3-oxoacyl-ACP reductase FabG [Clostridia bacterium]